MDREWVVRNVLGGMAAGFGLRGWLFPCPSRSTHSLTSSSVVLDCPPVFTTLVVLSGWGVKTTVANVISGWAGVSAGMNEETAGEMWLAYSIP